jgi:nitroreductase
LARRDTIRRFDPDAKITDSELRAIVDAGRKAPTSGTVQMYSFIRISDADTRSRIHELCGGGTTQIEECSEFLVVCADLRRVLFLHEHRDIGFAASPLMALLETSIDAALAAEGVMVAAESRGYGVCPIGNIMTNLDGIASLLDLPQGVLPLFGLSIGVALEEEVRGCPRIPLDAVLHEETYQDPDDNLLRACFDEMDERYADENERTWDGTLANYWSPDGFMNDREAVLKRTLHQQGFFAFEGVDAPRGDGTAPDPDEHWTDTAEESGD